MRESHGVVLPFLLTYLIFLPNSLLP